MECQPLSTLIGLDSLSKEFTIERFRQIFSYPTWNLVMETIDYTRSYELALEKGLQLLKYAEEYKKSFTEEEYYQYLQTLYLFILFNLDKLDRWEEFIEIWGKIRNRNNLTIKYPKNFRFSDREDIRRIQECVENEKKLYIISEDNSYRYVHFLHQVHTRKVLIDKKITKKRAGKKIGNLYHAKQENLTEEEIKIRFNKMLKKIGYVEKFNYLINRAKER